MKINLYRKSVAASFLAAGALSLTSLLVEATTLQTFDEWAAALPAQARGPSDDSDGDGIVNLVEYAFGLDPSNPTRDGLPAITYSNGEAILSLTRPKSVVGIEYLVRVGGEIDRLEKHLDLVKVRETSDSETLEGAIPAGAPVGFAESVLVRLVPPTLIGHSGASRPAENDYVLPYDIQAAFNNDTFFWHVSYPGNEGRRHDYFRFTNGAWRKEGGDRRDAQSSLDQQHEQGSLNEKSTIYEQRTSVMISDPSALSHVSNFSSFGCFLACHNQSRHMPEWTDEAGEDTKYIDPSQVSDGAQGSSKVLDLWHWRGARSNPIWRADDQYIEAKAFSNTTAGDDGGRKGDGGAGVFQSQSLVDGHPAFVFDPATTGGKFAFHWEDFWKTPLSYIVQPDAAQLGPNAPNPVAIPWADAVAAGYSPSEGDTVPRRVLRAGSGSRADITAFGSEFIRETPAEVFGQEILGRWSVQMQRKLDTGNDDDVRLVPGNGYDAGFEVHLWEYTTRDHYVGFPLRFTLGPGGDVAAVDLRGPGADGPLPLPDWTDTAKFPVKRIYLFQPGINTWEFLTGGNEGKTFMGPMMGQAVDQVHGGALAVSSGSVSCTQCHKVRDADPDPALFNAGSMEQLARQRGGVWAPTPVLITP